MGRNDPPPDPYAALGIGPAATAAEVRRAYLKKAREHHPDRTGKSAGPEWEEANRRTAAVNAAWELLRDPEARSRYDRGREAEAERVRERRRSNGAAPRPGPRREGGRPRARRGGEPPPTGDRGPGPWRTWEDREEPVRRPRGWQFRERIPRGAEEALRAREGGVRHGTGTAWKHVWSGVRTAAAGAAAAAAAAWMPRMWTAAEAARTPFAEEAAVLLGAGAAAAAGWKTVRSMQEALREHGAGGARAVVLTPLYVLAVRGRRVRYEPLWDLEAVDTTTAAGRWKTEVELSWQGGSRRLVVSARSRRAAKRFVARVMKRQQELHERVQRGDTAWVRGADWFEKMRADPEAAVEAEPGRKAAIGGALAGAAAGVAAAILTG